MKFGYKFNRRDHTHDEVMGWYKELHCSVVDTHRLGSGAPDLLVGIQKMVNDWVEVKTDHGHLEDSQIRFQRAWGGRKVVIVRTRADVINHVLNVREDLSDRAWRQKR